MAAKRRDKIARATEIGSGSVAGTVGVALGAEKLRDAYQRDYPNKYETHAANAERVAGRVAPKAGRLTRVASSGRVPFTVLAAGTAAAATTTGAKRYRRRHPVTKAAPLSAAEHIVNIPKTGHVRGIGRVRVLHYHGNGHFMVLDRTDSKRLVHRDKIRFAKAAGEDTSAFGIGHISKGQPLALQATDDLDVRVRRLKRKTLPSVPQIVARAGDKTRAIVANEQTKLDKAFDPDRSRTRRRRLTEGALSVGSTAAGVGSVRAAQEGRGHLAAASSRAAQRDRAWSTSARDMKPHAESLDAMAAARTGAKGKGVTGARLSHAAQEAHNMRNNINVGYTRHHQALHHAAQGGSALRRSRNLRVAAVGLGVGAVAAHRHER